MPFKISNSVEASDWGVELGAMLTQGTGGYHVNIVVYQVAPRKEKNNA